MSVFRETHVAAPRAVWSARLRPEMTSVPQAAGIVSLMNIRGLQRGFFSQYEGNPTCCGGCPKKCKDAARLDNGLHERYLMYNAF